MHFYQKWLTDELTKRKLRNSNYSLRGFSKSLKISASLLSGIMSGSKKPSASIAAKIIVHSEMSEADKANFIHAMTDELVEEINNKIIIELSKK